MLEVLTLGQGAATLPSSVTCCVLPLQLHQPFHLYREICSARQGRDRASPGANKPESSSKPNPNATASTLVRTGFYFSFFTGWVDSALPQPGSHKSPIQSTAVEGLGGQRGQQRMKRPGRPPPGASGEGVHPRQCFRCPRKGWEGEHTGCPLPLLPHTQLFQGAQVLAQERENRGNPKTDKNTLKRYSEGSL